MASRLHQVLTFVAVGAGGQATLPHDIRWNNRAVKPDWVISQNGNGAWTLIATTETSITIQNDEAAPANFTFWLLSHHSITRAFGAEATKFLSPLPFAVGGGGGGSGGVSIIEGGGVPVAGAPHTTINFTGGGVVATDAGGGVVDVAIAGGGSNVVVWDVGKTWADAYLEVQALTGPVIVLVEFDYVNIGPLGYRQMTAEGGGAATDLWNVLFVAMNTLNSSGSVQEVTVEIEDGFVLGAEPTSNQALLQSTSINWISFATTTPMTVGKLVSMRLDYGGFEAGGTIPPFDVNGFGFSGAFTNYVTFGAISNTLVDNTDGTTPVDITLTTGATVGENAIGDGRNATISIDAMSNASSTAFATNPTLGDIRYLDHALQVDYEDGLATGAAGGTGGSLQAEEVQPAIDALKFMTAPERRNAGWAAGLGTTITAITHWGWFVPTLGSGTIGNSSATDGTAVATGTLRKRFTSAAGANNAAELLQGSTFIGFYISALPGFGGFKAVMRFAPGITNPALKRGFFGFTDSGAALVATQSPSALLNCFGFAFDSAETTFRWQHNDGAGAATRIDLGANFPTRDATALFTTMIWCAPNTRAVNYWIKNETLQEIVQGVVTTDLPADGLGLAPHMHENNGGTASTTEWDFAYADFFLP